jgi:hypothetical protein
MDSNFNVSFPTTPCSPTLNKTNVVHNDLKKDSINEFGLTYWTSIPVWVNFQEHVSKSMMRYSLSNRCSSIKQTDHHDITENYVENGINQP